VISLSDRQKCDDMSIRLDTIPTLDRRTDGQICHINNALCMHCIVTCRKWQRLRKTAGIGQSAPFRPTGEDQLEDLVTHGWQRSLTTWNNSSSPWTTSMNWLLIAHSDDTPVWCMMIIIIGVLITRT